MMHLTGLHLLLTYRCTLECDHCFVWGSPWQSGAMTLPVVERILERATAYGKIQWIYFEGGEPFLFYAVLLEGVRQAAALGFKVGIVSNAFWANHNEDALAVLRPFAGLVADLSISSDLYHHDSQLNPQAECALAAAHALGIPADVISIAQPEGTPCGGEGRVMFRGRAAARLADRAPHNPWAQFTTCPEEDLREPGRVHVDPMGNMHICQGISLGNLLETPLEQICLDYDPATHPVTAPLLLGGPAELVRRYQLAYTDTYADACHLCDHARRQLRERFPEILAPGQMYGENLPA